VEKDEQKGAADLNLALIGNCQYSALIDTKGSVVWACFPRFDSPSVFGSLLDEEIGGRWTIEGAGEGWTTEARYIEHSCIVSTVWKRNGESFEVIDYAPRFHLHERFYRPPMIVRLVKRLAGRPRVRVVCDPRFDYGRSACRVTRGSNHITFEDSASLDRMRLSTDASITNVSQGLPFELTKNIHFALAWGEPFEASFGVLDDFLSRTKEYWRQWCKSTRIPVNYQSEVLRAAMTLKLHTFEDTGAVIAATTTSIPEAVGTGRNWDYRFCWLRDAAFVIRALLRMGHSNDAERFCGYLRNLIPDDADGRLPLQPVYGLDGTAELTEVTLDHLAGYRGSGPVRIGNQAYTHTQNDVYGEVVLALAPLFYDERLLDHELEPVYETIEHLVASAINTFEDPDASIWEYRGTSAHHVFSKFMAWVALDRGAGIAERMERVAEADSWRQHAERMKEQIIARGYNETVGAFTAVYETDNLDASLLLMTILKFLPVDDPRMTESVEAMRKGLDASGFLYRYRHEDDFGSQSSAFTICSTWMVEALWMTGREDEAREMFERLLDARNDFGLLSEDIDPETGELWGNFPQTYSMLGLINCAVRLSPPWSEIF
jgi:GH15 family glucan-1,4-alpha-glucosidase